MKILVSILGAILSALYLSNIGLGVVELIPDNIPVAGNIDELVASLILLRCLLNLGLDPIALKKAAMRSAIKQEKLEAMDEE